MNALTKHIPNALSLFMAVIFLDSLRYKFTDHPKTQVIFGRLNDWAGTLGLAGLFGHTGLFSQYVIGSAELVASFLLIVGILPKLHHWQALGSLLGFAIMMGAVNFHLWTPLTIDPNKDGGGLFMAACMNLVFAVLMLAFFRRNETIEVARRIAAVFAPLK